jgi:hypothetical protein
MLGLRLVSVRVAGKDVYDLALFPRAPNRIYALHEIEFTSKHDAPRVLARDSMLELIVAGERKHHVRSQPIQKIILGRGSPAFELGSAFCNYITELIPNNFNVGRAILAWSGIERPLMTELATDGPESFFEMQYSDHEA